MSGRRLRVRRCGHHKLNSYLCICVRWMHRCHQRGLAGMQRGLWVCCHSRARHVPGAGGSAFHAHRRQQPCQCNHQRVRRGGGAAEPHGLHAVQRCAGAYGAGADGGHGPTAGERECSFSCTAPCCTLARPASRQQPPQIPSAPAIAHAGPRSQRQARVSPPPPLPLPLPPSLPPSPLPS